MFVSVGEENEWLTSLHVLVRLVLFLLQGDHHATFRGYFLQIAQNKFLVGDAFFPRRFISQLPRGEEKNLSRFLEFIK